MMPEARRSLIIKIIVLLVLLAAFAAGWLLDAPTGLLVLLGFCAAVVLFNLKPEKPAPPTAARPHQHIA